MRPGTILLAILSPMMTMAQMVPSPMENIDFIVTFGKQAQKSWGDDDNVQTYFLAIPSDRQEAVYVRIFDPDIGGMHDQQNGSSFNTKCDISIYGGPGAYSNQDARQVNPVGNYDSGIQLHTTTFSNDNQYDNKWYTFGPLNPKEGEFDEALDAYVFKLIIKGGSGDDGNLYRFFLSSSDQVNTAVEGANAFAYELSFRLKKDPKAVAHFYPFVKNDVIAVKVNSFDFDNGGQLRLYSVAKQLRELEASGDGEWVASKQDIVEKEHNTSLDYQIINTATFSNDMVIYFTNQYNHAIPFFSNPIGGAPQYDYMIDVDYTFD